MAERSSHFWQSLRRWLWPLREGSPVASDEIVTPAVASVPAQPLPAACATVVIPALNEAERIGGVVRHALADPVTAEVLVIDDSSTDDTARLAAEAGAQVLRSTMLGKGASMRDGAIAARHDLVVYLDGDLAGLQPAIVSELCRPLCEDRADFVKARFGRIGGRVTELTAKPMLKVFFPELAAFAQPLGGLIAARRRLLRQLDFEDGYGVDVGLLIDAHRSGARLAEVDVGSLEHDSQSLPDLALMANEVSRVIYGRARAAGRLHVEQIAAMFEIQRQAASSLDYVMTKRRGRTRVLLLDMDGTLSPDRYVLKLARAVGVENELMGLLDNPADDAATRSSAIAALFRFVHRRQFEKAAHEMALRNGVIECINAMRRAGFMVGVITDSWFVAAEIMRRRVFADFALAHTLHFDGDVCGGSVNINPAFQPSRPGAPAVPCKGEIVRRIRSDGSGPAVTEIWAVGDNLNDIGMLREADRAFVIEPKSPSVARESDAKRLAAFADLALELLERPAAGSTAAAAAARIG